MWRLLSDDAPVLGRPVLQNAAEASCPTQLTAEKVKVVVSVARLIAAC